MKIVLVFAALLAGISASILPKADVVPQAEFIPQIKEDITLQQERFVDDIIISIIDDLIAQIREAGLDPYFMDRGDLGLGLPVPVLFNINFFLQNLRVTGISNIVIHRMNYGILTSRLTFDISLPEIAIDFGNGGFDTTILGHDFQGRTDFRLNIIEPRVSGLVQINLLGAILGNLVTRIEIDFDLGGLQYEGNMQVLGMEFGDLLTEIISVSIPAAMRELRAEVNELVEIIAWLLVDQLF